MQETVEGKQIPDRAALVYNFVNSLDRRSYMRDGFPMSGGDAMADRLKFVAWLRSQGLTSVGGSKTAEFDHQRALEFREALRSYLEVSPENRSVELERVKRLNEILEQFPIAVRLPTSSGSALCPAPASGALGEVVTRLASLAEDGLLNRLKMCASDNCHWIFYDQTKPANRRWCSPLRCGNREKTRLYRRRRSRDNKDETAKPQPDG